MSHLAPAAGARNRGTATGRGRFRLRWVVRVTVGEVLGSTAPAVVGAAFVSAPATVEVPALAAAGLVEGALLGAAQASVLRRALPVLRTGWFVVATALAAATAYAVAMVPVVLGDRVASLPVPVQVAGGAALGAVLLSTVGTAQWLVLRRAVPGPVFWIPATAAAWAVGLGAFLTVSTPLWQPGQSLALTVAIGVLAAIVMGLTVAVLTLPAALRLVAVRAPVGVRAGRSGT